uniref:Kazal-type proteinase inhibitor n=1 Tax=Penaeus chinensis TaxID=139456 RepID=B9TTW4_PENCE|nr:Kazal-type proteinase inhibitor [Penaeus chinensis]ACB47428.1 Kazal-type proteinase inhibitor [Penaeus chinensis]
MFYKTTLLILFAVAVSGYGRGKFRPCARFCPLREELPVCGSNGKTYPSRCHLDNENCRDKSITFVHHGSCEPPLPCPGVCPAVYDPVCGTDGRTYSNVCDLVEAARCEGRDVSVDHNGACGRKTSFFKLGY